VKVEGGAGLVEKVPFVGEVWVSSRTTHCVIVVVTI